MATLVLGEQIIQKKQQQQQQQQKRTIVIGMEQQQNPLTKLLSGFCHPFINQNNNAHNDDDDEDNKTAMMSPEYSPKYMPDLGPQTTSATTTKSLNDIRIPILSDSQQNNIDKRRGMSDLTIDSTHHTEEEHSSSVDRPEMHVLQMVTNMRRKRGIEVFLVSCIFVVGTLFTLSKLGGYSIADLHFPTTTTSSTSSSNFMFDASFPFNNRWIHIYDKRKVQQQQVNDDEIKVSAIPSIDPQTVMMTKNENENENTIMKDEEGGEGTSDNHQSSSEEKSESEDNSSPDVELKDSDLQSEESVDDDGRIVEEIEGEL